MQLDQMAKMVMFCIKIKKLIIISVKKKHIQNHVLEMVQAIISCFEKRYGNLNSHETEAAVNINSDQGDRNLFDVYCILNCNLYPKPTSNVEAYIVQLNGFKNVKTAAVAWKVFMVFTVEDVTEGFSAITSYAYRYFEITNIKLMEF